MSPSPFVRSARGLVVTLIWLAAGTVPLAADPAAAAAPELPEGPDFEDVLSVPSLGDPEISPDGRAIAYTVRTTDWDDNRYDTEIWLAPAGGEPFPLTRTDGKSSSGPRWSPDGEWIAFLADRGDGRQIHLIRPRGGEAKPLTAVEGGVAGFRWSPDGRQMAVALTEPEAKDAKKLEKRYGKFAIEDAEHRMTHLWLLDVEAARASRDGAEKPKDDSADPGDEAPAGEEEEAAEDNAEEDEAAEDGGEGEEDDDEDDPDDEAPALRRLTRGEDFTVDDFEFSPDGTKIAFSHRAEPTIIGYDSSDLSILELDSGEIRSLVERPAYDGGPIWSPDGEWILFETNNQASAYYLNGELAKVAAGGGDVELLTGAFDENPSALAWLDDGIRFSAFQKTRRVVFQLAPDTGAVEPLSGLPPRTWRIDYASDSPAVAILAEEPGQLPEIYRLADEQATPVAVTAISEEVAGWPLPRGEMISWTSRDDTPIEGVLFKPAGVEGGERRPLLVIVHGGPAAISIPRSIYSYVYPVQQWLAKGALILMPNYRGSTGYGEAFRARNVRNLGVGDAWDVLSGVDHLVESGLADPDRLGVMGWSQGGYISAFLATTSDRFQAISVGAGISNWMTYYVNTDIHPFTRHYLQGTPWSDPEIYAKTSPMTYVNQAKTPTLIQHGENDRRVPIPNAYELFQGLQDVGVETRLIVYKDFGHGISKPKERLAAVWHNWQWFAQHIWGETVDLPLE